MTDLAKPSKRNGSLKGEHLPTGEVVPLISDDLFKKVFADPKHLERLNYLLSSILNEDVKVLEILNDELIGEYRLESKKCVDLVCKTNEFDYTNIEVNTTYGLYERNRNLEFLFRLASASYRPDSTLPKKERRRIRRAKKHYIQINLNDGNTCGKPYVVFSINDIEDAKNNLTDEIKIININVSYYRDVCYNKGIDELTDFEIAVGIIGIYEEKMLEKISIRNDILKGISDIVKKYSWEDDVIVPYDREEYLKEAFEANIEYAVEDAITETTKRVTEKTSADIAKKMKQEKADVAFIAKVTGLSKNEIEKL